MKKLTLVKKTLLVLLLISSPVMAADKNATAQNYTTQGDYVTVRDAIISAVEGRGLKINHINHISDMLARTGQDVGDSKQIYLNAEQMEFCSATLSRTMMEADASNIIVCPYSITVYNLPANPKTIYVMYRKPPSAKSAKSIAVFKQVEKLLNDIITEGIDLSK
ncbi:MAG: DUF302 domain-containing protein [Sulfuriferula sp.]|nr:DUF302 domain-containing protein [Sulfuriferula sp.]